MLVSDITQGCITAGIEASFQSYWNGHTDWQTNWQKVMSSWNCYLDIVYWTVAECMQTSVF